MRNSSFRQILLVAIGLIVVEAIRIWLLGKFGHSGMNRGVIYVCFVTLVIGIQYKSLQYILKNKFKPALFLLLNGGFMVLLTGLFLTRGKWQAADQLFWISNKLFFSPLVLMVIYLISFNSFGIRSENQGK